MFCNFIRFGLSALSALVISACSEIQLQAPSDLGSRELTGRVAERGGEFGSGLGGFYYAFQVVEIDGLAAVCGTKAFTGHSRRTASEELLQNSNLFIEETRVINSFGYFARADSREELLTTTANCRTLGVFWDPSFARATWTITRNKNRIRV